MTQETMDVQDAAALIGITTSGLRRMMREGRSPNFFKVGRLCRFRRSDIDAWIEGNMVVVKAQPRNPSSSTQGEDIAQ